MSEGENNIRESSGKVAEAPNNEDDANAQSTETELHEKTKLAEEYEDKWKRALADLDNMRKRTEREIDTLRKYASEPLVLDILRSVEDMERALTTSKISKAKLVEGLNLILTEMKSTLEKNGISKIDSVGNAFDSTMHEAVQQSTTDCCDDDDIIIEELQKGYKLHDKVIRCAKVNVAKYYNNKKEDE